MTSANGSLSKISEREKRVKQFKQLTAVHDLCYTMFCSAYEIYDGVATASNKCEL